MSLRPLPKAPALRCRCCGGPLRPGDLSCPAGGSLTAVGARAEAREAAADRRVGARRTRAIALPFFGVLAALALEGWLSGQGAESPLVLAVGLVAMVGGGLLGQAQLGAGGWRDCLGAPPTPADLGLAVLGGLAAPVLAHVVLNGAAVAIG